MVKVMSQKDVERWVAKMFADGLAGRPHDESLSAIEGTHVDPAHLEAALYKVQRIIAETMSDLPEALDEKLPLDFETKERIRYRVDKQLTEMSLGFKTMIEDLTRKAG